MKLSAFGTMVLAALLTLGATNGYAAKVELPQWHIGEGKVIVGKIVDSLGPLVLIANNNTIRFIDIEKLPDDEALRVADFIEQSKNENRSWKTSEHKVSASLRRNLVGLSGNKVAAVNVSDRNEPRFYLLYFSAAWCGPCHRFTPKLIEAYNAAKAKLGDRIELVFVSSDRSKAEQVEYIAEFKMPWLALNYSDVGSVPVIERWGGRGIPSLVMVTRDGDAMFHSYRGDEYVGPQDVLAKLQALEPLMLAAPGETNEYNHRLALIRHVRDHGATGAPVSVYAGRINWNKYKGLKAGRFEADVDVDAKGRMVDVRFGASVPSALFYVLKKEMETWRFLPQVAGGVAVPSVMHVVLREE